MNDDLARPNPLIKLSFPFWIPVLHLHPKTCLQHWVSEWKHDCKESLEAEKDVVIHAVGERDEVDGPWVDRYADERLENIPWQNKHRR